MESEEYEQIPWSNLVSDAQPTVDRRLYVAGGVIAAIVVAFFAVRAFGSEQGRSPIPTTDVVSPTVALGPGDVQPPAVATIPPSEPVGAISEADLMAGLGDPPLSGTEIPALIGEWFVTDFFTRDGSSETIASLGAALGSVVLVADLPHHDESQPDTFVEWARAFGWDRNGPSLELSVAYRTVHEEQDGFVRDPVRAVVVSLIEEDDGWEVEGFPIPIDVP